MNQKQKTMLKRIVAAAIVYIAAAAAKKMNVFAGMPQPWTELVVFLIPYLIIGWDIVYKAFRGIKNGQVFDTLPLSIMGLMSDLGYEKVNEILGRMIPEAHRMGIPDGFDPFITLSFMALPVIPEIRVTPRGIYLVKEDRLLRNPYEK